MLKLQQTLDKMHEYNVAPSAVTYGTVVKAYGRARDIDAVLKVWNDMRTRCLGVNPVTCGCVLDACVKCGHLDKAMAIFQEMRLQGLHKNTVLYATLIKGLAKVRDLAGAVHLYQEMRMESVPCNLVTFNSLMDVCVRCGDLHMAALFLQDMMAMGIDPDLITFSTLIKGYSHTGEVHKALALSKELKSRGLKCDEIMYNSLIDGCAKANKLQEGLMVFEDMLQSRVAPSNITFSILVKLEFEAGRIAEAFRLVDEMASRYRCVPSRIVYTVLLRCCGNQGGPALARGAAMLTELASKRNSKLPDQGMVSAVIAGCIQHNDFELALGVVKEFAAAGGARRGSTGLVPLDCLRTLFEALGAHDQSRGHELLELLRRRSLPSAQIAQMQTALADGRSRSGGNTGNGGAAAMQQTMAQTNMEGYAQWIASQAYAVQPNLYISQQYSPDMYNHVAMGYQQQHLDQLAYFGNYLPAHLPPYQGAVPATALAQAHMPPTVAMPQMPGPVPPLTGGLLPPAMMAHPEVATAYAPGLLPPAPPPINSAATAPAANSTAPDTSHETGPPKQARPRQRRSADKENTAPAQPKEAPILGQTLGQRQLSH
jgi:pentatricopeptide repeat protein